VFRKQSFHILILFILLFSIGKSNAFSKNQLKRIKYNQEAEKIEGKGELSIYYVDSMGSQLPQQKERILYKLNDENNNRYEVAFLDSIEIPQEKSIVNYSGYLYKNRLYITDLQIVNNKNTYITSNVESDAIGNKKLLAVKVADSTKEIPTFGISDEDIKLKYKKSKNSLINFYKDNSKGKFNLEVKIYNDVLEIPNFCSNPNNYSPFHNDTYYDAIEYLDYKYPDLENFDYVSFILPDNQDCMNEGVLGIATLGKDSIAINNKEFNLGIHFLQSFENTMRFRYTLFHEFAHNIGIQHDNANVCGRKILSEDYRCRNLIYGGAHSIMGHARSLAHINVANKKKLNWLDEDEAVVYKDDSFSDIVDIQPVSSKVTGYKMIEVKRDNYTSLIIEKRAPIGFDGISSGLEGYKSNGILIYFEDYYKASSILMDKSTKDRRKLMNIEDYKGYYDYEHALKMHNRALIRTSFYDHVEDIKIVPIFPNIRKDGSARIIISKNTDPEDFDLEILADNLTIAAYANAKKSVSELKLGQEYKFRVQFKDERLTKNMKSNLVRKKLQKIIETKTLSLEIDADNDGWYEQESSLNKFMNSYITENKLPKFRLVDKYGFNYQIENLNFSLE